MRFENEINGQIVLVRKRNEVGAFILSNQFVGRAGLIETGQMDYVWFYRKDRKGLLDPSEPSVTSGSVTGATQVAFGSFSVPWSMCGQGTGWVYYSALPIFPRGRALFEMCVTSELRCGASICRKVAGCRTSGLSSCVRIALGTGSVTGRVIGGRYMLFAVAVTTAERSLALDVPRRTAMLYTTETSALLEGEIPRSEPVARFTRTTGDSNVSCAWAGNCPGSLAARPVLTNRMRELFTYGSGGGAGGNPGSYPAPNRGPPLFFRMADSEWALDSLPTPPPAPRSLTATLTRIPRV